MKTQGLSDTLIAFATLVEASRADDLRKFAGVFGAGKDETRAARLKSIRRPSANPVALRSDLEAIQAALRAAGASKQAAGVGEVLELFAGASDAGVEAFVALLVVPPPAPPKRRKSTAAQKEPDVMQARSLADELTRAVLDAGAFSEVVERLGKTKIVSTPTLDCVANRFLGSSKRYSKRKDAIDDIRKRRLAEAREHARSQALSRLGV